MGVRENKIETYFKEKVKLELQGIARKWKCSGVDGVPDQIPVWPAAPGQVFVEIKTSTGTKSPAQTREQDRLRDAGALVFTVYGHSGVENFIRAALKGVLWHIQAEGEIDLK